MSYGKNSDEILKGLTDHLRRLLLACTCNENLEELGFSDTDSKAFAHHASKMKPQVIAKMIGHLIDVKRGVSVNMDLQALLEKWVIDSITTVSHFSKK